MQRNDLIWKLLFWSKSESFILEGNHDARVTRWKTENFGLLFKLIAQPEEKGNSNLVSLRLLISEKKRAHRIT